MNSHCSVCDVEHKCAYPYKPCDCCNYRKFVPKIVVPVKATVIQFPIPLKK